MNRKVLALLALAAFGLSAGASFDAYAYNRYDCLLECRAEYDECLSEGGGSACYPSYRECTNYCKRNY